MAIYDVNGNEIYGGEKTDIVTLNDKALTIEKLQQLNRRTRLTGGGSPTYSSIKPLSLLHFSDIHGDTSALSRIVDYYNEYTEYIDDVLCTGDVVKDSSADGFSYWGTIDGTENILNCIGNHDTRVGNNWVSLSEQNAYETYFAPYISNWDVTIGNNVCYYYKDYTGSNVRLIVLDGMHQNATQLSWFVSTLSDALTNNLHVLCATHICGNKTVNGLDTVWNDDNDDYTITNLVGTSYPESMVDAYASAVDDFQTNGGCFIAWLHGHLHMRIFGTVNNYPNQLDIAVMNAGDTYASNRACERIDNTKTQDAFNLVAVDAYQKIIRLASVGANIDRHMIRWRTISYDYDNHTLVYEG